MASYPYPPIQLDRFINRARYKGRGRPKKSDYIYGVDVKHTNKTLKTLIEEGKE